MFYLCCICYRLCSGNNAMREKCPRSFFWSVFSPNAGKYGQDKTPYLDTFHVVMVTIFSESILYWPSANTIWANLELNNRGHSKK